MTDLPDSAAQDAANKLPIHRLTPAEILRLNQLRVLAGEFHSLLRGIEAEAYQITREEDRSGHTTDFVYCGLGSVEELLARLGMEMP